MLSTQANMQNRRNLYRLLQVQPDAPEEIIKSSYRTLMQKLGVHPDLGGDTWNAALINDAYSILSNPQKRAQYDAEQLKLRNSVGPTARDAVRGARPQSERTGNREAPNRDNVFQQEPAGTTSTSNYRDNDPLICVFCGVRNAVSEYQAPDDVCSHCASPMRFVEATTGQIRGSRRIEHQDNIQVRIDATRPDTFTATVLDLSPTGLRFVSQHRLKRGRIVKLDSAALSAVAIVTYSTREQTPGQFSTGVQFLTFKANKVRGMFVSSKT